MPQDKRKIIQYKLANEEGDDELYNLSFRMSRALIQTIEYFRWMTRHLQLPADLDTQIKLNDWSDDLSQRLMQPIDICSELANCVPELEGIISNSIAESSSVQGAIRDFIANDPELQEIIKSLAGQAVTAQIIEPWGNGDCDSAVIYGGTTQLISDIDANNVDLLEIIEVATNLIERQKIFVNAIPIFSASFTDEALDAFDNVISSFQENYVAESTISYRKELACKLLCIIQTELRDCQPTFNDIYDFFVAELGGEISTQTLFTDSMTYLLTGIWTGPQIFLSMCLVQLTAFRWANQWLGLDISGLKYSYKIGAEAPIESWNEDCDDCGETLYWSLADEPSHVYPVEYYGVIDTQTSTSITCHAVNMADSVFRLKLVSPVALRLLTVSYSAVSYFTDPGGLSIPMPAVGNVQGEIFMASSGAFSLEMTFEVA